MIWLFIFLVFIYCQDKYKLVRHSNATYYTTRRLSTAFHLWWAMPTGAFAMVVAWWGLKSNLGAWGKYISSLGPTWMLLLMVFVVHCTLYLIIAHLIYMML